MPTVDYVPFGTASGSNIDTQPNYVAGTYRTAGFSSGEALSIQINKAVRQASMGISCMANYISVMLGINVLDDGNLTGLIASFTGAIRAQVLSFFTDAGFLSAFNAQVAARLAAAPAITSPAISAGAMSGITAFPGGTRVDASGNVIVPGGLDVEIGTFNKLSPAFADLSVENDSGVAAQFMNNSAGPGSAVLIRSDGTNIGFIAFTFGGVDVGSISTDGSTTSYNTVSDYRIKSNIRPMANVLEQIAKLKPSMFCFGSDETKAVHHGLIAHELQEIIPEAVHGTKDAVREGKPVLQSVDYSKLVPYLIAGIQELSAKVDALKKQGESK